MEEDMKSINYGQDFFVQQRTGLAVKGVEFIMTEYHM
jgi:hypothetical protein